MASAWLKAHITYDMNIYTALLALFVAGGHMRWFSLAAVPRVRCCVDMIA